MRRKRISKRDRQLMFGNRSYFAGAVMVAGAIMLLGRAVKLQVFDKAFLNDQADARHIRAVELSAHRGTITDRNGEVLAVSTPVDSVWVDPGIVVKDPEHILVLARLLGMDHSALRAKLSRSVEKNHLYLKRHMSPSDAARIAREKIPGVHLQREYHRYYPVAEVSGHLIGFADIDDKGQEGLELAFNHPLTGLPGKKRVLQDERGRLVEDIDRISAPVHGQNIATSIDLRIQYLAYRELKKAVQQHKAKSGSAVVMDVLTGEVLAMVNQPAYNPNDRSQLHASRYKNRAITDFFEPGSSMKPLIIAAALESGKYHSKSRVNTSPGSFKVGNKTIKDPKNYGRIGLGTILARSSNVGASKIALSLEREQLWQVLSDFGLGRPSASSFPGESAGILSDYHNWRDISQATLAYGYGLSVTPLQLAQAYAVLGAKGLQHPVSLLKLNQLPIPRRVISAATAEAVLGLMEDVVARDGTGFRAAVPGYRVAGKTGTTLKYVSGGYSDDRYTAIFAGVAPLTNPRLAVVVVVDEPSLGDYYGGKVAAPVFSSIVASTVRILAIPPDDLRGTQSGAFTAVLRE